MYNRLPGRCVALAEGYLNMAIAYHILGWIPSNCYDNARCVKKLSKILKETDNPATVIGFIDYESEESGGDKRIRLNKLLETHRLEQAAAHRGILVYTRTSPTAVYLVLFDGGPENVIRTLTRVRLSSDALSHFKSEEIVDRAKECRCPTRQRGVCRSICTVAHHAYSLLQRAGFTGC